jgi:hypothetical protein
MGAGTAQGPQLLDLLQLSRHEKESRDKALMFLRELKDWEIALKHPVHPRIRPYVRARAIAMRHEARKAVHNYRQVKRGRIEMFRNYIESLPNYGGSKRLAS